MKKTGLILLSFAMFVTMGCSQKETVNAEKHSQSASAIVSKMVGNNSQPRAANAIPAPNFTLKSVNGEKFTLSEHKGKVILLNFWGTWCAPCRKEIPDFNKLYSKHNKKGLEIVGITLSSGSESDISDFMEKWNMEYTVLTDISGNETGQVTGLYGQAIGQAINGIPTTFIIDREGYIVKGYIGPRSENVFYNDLKDYL